MNAWGLLSETLLTTVRDVVPITVIVVFFQLVILRRAFAEPHKLLAGFVCVVLGLALFLIGLELALFPLGEAMAQQLASPEFVGGVTVEPAAGDDLAVTSEVAAGQSVRHWYHYYWVYVFAFTIGLSTTIAEPALIAVAAKAGEVSGGTIRETELRLVVALGVGVGVALGTFRIVVGHPLPLYILPGYLVVIIQTVFAPKAIIPIAYDSGGVTTSTVTVPIVAALGLGLATQIEGADPLIDGFGLIAFASLFPVMSVMGYAQISHWKTQRRGRRAALAHRQRDDAPAISASSSSSTGG